MLLPEVVFAEQRWKHSVSGSPPFHSTCRAKPLDLTCQAHVVSCSRLSAILSTMRRRRFPPRCKEDQRYEKLLSHTFGKTFIPCLSGDRVLCQLESRKRALLFRGRGCCNCLNCELTNCQRHGPFPTMNRVAVRTWFHLTCSTHTSFATVRKAAPFSAQLATSAGARIPGCTVTRVRAAWRRILPLAPELAM